MAARAAAILIGLYACSALALDVALLREAKSLIDAGQADAAYARLQALEDSAAGDPAFDYLLGLAALDSGRATEAIFALQRAVDVDPQHGPARAELARALLAVNETDAARRELASVREQGPPPEVAATVERYLGLIDRYHGAYRTHFAPYIAAGIGFDTNINSATDQNQVAAPALGGLVFDLDSDSQETSSPIGDLAAGFSFSSPLNRNWRLIGGIDLAHRLTPRDGDFTTTHARGHTGLDLTQGAEQWSAVVQAEKYRVDGSGATDSDRELAGLMLQWRHAWSQTTQTSLFGQGALIRYPDQEVRNVNRYIGGAGIAHGLPDWPGSPILFASAFGGVENSQNDRVGTLGTSGKHFDRDLYGVRAGAERKLGPRGTLYGSVTYQKSDYNAPDPLFLAQRDDDYVDVTLGYRHALDESWSVTPQLSWSNNDSNLVITDYDRFELMLVVRNEF